MSPTITDPHSPRSAELPPAPGESTCSLLPEQNTALAAMVQKKLSGENQLENRYTKKDYGVLTTPANNSYTLDVPLFSGYWGERGEPGGPSHKSLPPGLRESPGVDVSQEGVVSINTTPSCETPTAGALTQSWGQGFVGRTARLIRPTKAIAEGAIAEEEDRSGEAAAAPVTRKKWNIEYTGSTWRGIAHGQGEATFADGGSYKGDFYYGVLHGCGEAAFADGEAYRGEWAYSKCHGQGTVTLKSGKFYSGQFVKGHIQSTLSNLSNLPLIELLLGSEDNDTVLPEFPLGAIADFLDKFGYAELGSHLKHANNVLRLDDHELESYLETVYDRLVYRPIPEHGKNYLFTMMTDTGTEEPAHIVGLNIRQERNSPGLVFFELFNSGEGLEYYHRTQGNKFETITCVQVPIANLTPAIMKNLIRTEQSPCDIDDLYQLLRDLPEATEPEFDPNRAIYQTIQKSRNCTLEWIFAWLKHKMPAPVYHQMRLKLLETCYHMAEKTPPDWIAVFPQEQYKLDRLHQKIERRRERIQRLFPEKTGQSPSITSPAEKPAP